MITFYEKLIQRQGPLFEPLLSLVAAIAATDDATVFRAGQSLDALIISTTCYHGLKQKDAHVFVQAQQTTDLFLVEYWRGQNQDDRLATFVCAADELPGTVLLLMERLWHSMQGTRL